MYFNNIVIRLFIVDQYLNVETGPYYIGPMIIVLVYVLAVLTYNKLPFHLQYLQCGTNVYALLKNMYMKNISNIEAISIFYNTHFSFQIFLM